MEEPPTNRWHVGKEIPIALVVALFIQTGGAIWWAARLTSKVDTMLVEINELKEGKSAAEVDARTIILLRHQVDELNRRILILEEEEKIEHNFFREFPSKK